MGDADLLGLRLIGDCDAAARLRHVDSSMAESIAAHTAADIIDGQATL